MALSDIVNKIIGDAEAYAADLGKKIADQTARDQKNGEETISNLENQYAQETEQKKKRMEQKIHAHISMEEKAKESHVKKELTEHVIDQSLIKLSNLSEKDSITILQAIISELPSKGIVFPAKQQKNLVEKAISSLKKTELTIGEEKNIRGGVLFEGEKVDVNASFEHLLLHEILEPRETEFAHILFS